MTEYALDTNATRAPRPWRRIRFHGCLAAGRRVFADAGNYGAADVVGLESPGYLDMPLRRVLADDQGAVVHQQLKGASLGFVIGSWRIHLNRANLALNFHRPAIFNPSHGVAPNWLLKLYVLL